MEENEENYGENGLLTTWEENDTTIGHIEKNIDQLPTNDASDKNEKGDNEANYENSDVNINSDIEPKKASVIGKAFALKDDAYSFYNDYSLNHGFGIRIHGHTKSRTNQEVIQWQFVCNKQGVRYLKDKRQLGKDVKPHRETRIGCMAKMEIGLRNGEWIVDKFDDVHNHVLTTPSKVMKHRSHNKFHRTPMVKNLVYELNKKGMKPSTITRVVNAISGSEEVDITSKQCTDLLQAERKNHVGRECHGIVRHFHEKSKLDGSHYFAMDLASDGSLKSVFWADGRSRSAYSQFGDVLVFDVTYRTNHFRLPFAPFVGVNHHRQSILFGAALLEDETEGTFIWLFEQFLKCMFHREPLTIITDQDGAMRNAIRKIFCNTRHRLCAWHINKHVIEHLHPYNIRYADFGETYSKWQNSKTIEEFELGWEMMKARYNIAKGSWLDDMYIQRYYWVKVYLKDCFTTGMTTSGRSESMNSYFDGYVNSNTMLNDFVKQYDKAIESRRNKEADEDFRTLESQAMPLTNYPIEKQAGVLYTRNLFEIFKSEWRKSFDCIHKKTNKGGNFVEYLVGRHGLDLNQWRIVNYLSFGDISIKCSCCKFEMEGILCKHILYVVRKKNLDVIPEKYFLPRWTIKARHQGNMCETLVGSSELIETTPSSLGIWSVQRKFTIALEACRTSPADSKLLETLLDNYMDKVRSKRPNERVEEDKCGNNTNTSLVFVNNQCHMTIRDPARVAKNKGRPPLMKRMESGLELAAKAKKQKTCRTCNEKGHNSSGCSQRKAKQTEALSASSDF